VTTIIPFTDSAFKAGASVAVPTTIASIDSIVTTLAAGDNLVIAMVQLDPVSGVKIIAAGDLELRRGTDGADPLLSENQFQFIVANNVNRGNFMMLIGKDTSAPANPTYAVHAGADVTGMNAEVKFMVINAPPDSSFEDGGSVAIGTSETTLLSHASGLPSGDNIIIVVFQADKPDSSRTITAGNLKLKNGSTVIASNEFEIKTGSGDGKQPFHVLIARDAGAPANPTYDITALASGTGLNGEAKILVFNGLSSAIVDTGSVAIGTTRTVIGTATTTFNAGDDVVIGTFGVSDPAAGAIAFDADGGQIVTTQTNTLSFTVGSGTDKALYAITTIKDDGINKVSTLTWNGGTEAFTEVASSSSSDVLMMQLWVLKNPTSKADDIVATGTSDPPAQVLAVLSVTGVDQTASDPNNVIGTSHDGNYGIAITTLNANSWLFGGIGPRNANFDITPDYTSVLEIDDVPSLFSERRAVTTTGSYSLTWSGTGTASLNVGVMEINESSAAAARTLVAGNIEITRVGGTASVSEFDAFIRAGAPNGQSIFGMIKETTSVANEDYEGALTADATGLNADLKLIAIHIKDSPSKSLTEQVDITDQLAKSSTKSLTEQVDITDQLATTATFTKSLTEQVDITDTVTAGIAFTKSLTEQVDITDTVTATTATFTKSLTEQVDISDSVSTELVGWFKGRCRPKRISCLNFCHRCRF